jgi:hypothetical protein
MCMVVCMFVSDIKMSRRCMTDGFAFTGEPTLVPITYDLERETFLYENNVFCSPECAKGWLFRDVHNNTDRLHLFTLYCKKVLGLHDTIHICPDPRFIRDYMVEPEKGITIDTFRTRRSTHVLATGSKHVSPSVDSTVYLEEIKKDADAMDESVYTS